MDPTSTSLSWPSKPWTVSNLTRSPFKAVLPSGSSAAQMTSVVQTIAELRNRDGTGHGRSARSNLDQTHALLIRDVAEAWCRWVLATARRAQRAPPDEFISNISGPLFALPRHAADGRPQLLASWTDRHLAIRDYRVWKRSVEVMAQALADLLRAQGFEVTTRADELDLIVTRSI